MQIKQLYTTTSTAGMAAAPTAPSNATYKTSSVTGSGPYEGSYQQHLASGASSPSARYGSLAAAAAAAVGSRPAGSAAAVPLPPSPGPAQLAANARGRSSGGLSPADAADKYRRVLTAYEMDEIRRYPNVYFVGATARKIHGGKGKGPNCGYDDSKNRYRCIKNDHLAYRYEVVRGLGKGSFGDVVKAYDHKTKTHVAIKIIRNERRFHKQAQSEIRLLELIKRQDRRDKHNLVHLKDSFTFRGG
jgi:dual specificity tyrosine-phosphorylation-regulated kinase 2/3/4